MASNYSPDIEFRDFRKLCKDYAKVANYANFIFSER